MNAISTLGLTHEEWLLAREQGIGGSDAAALLGIDEYRTRVDLYYDKTGQPKPVEETLRMRLGKMLEPVVAGLWMQETGGMIRRDNKIRVAAGRPHLLANIDRLIVNDYRGPGVLEIKTTSSWRMDRAREAGHAVLPEHAAQLQHYLGVTGYAWGELAYLVDGGEFHRFTICRDDAWLDKTYFPLADEFWFGHVLAGIPPAPQTQDDVIRLYPRHEAGAAVEATPEALEAAVRLKMIKNAIKPLEEEEKDLTFKIKACLGLAESLTMHGETIATWRNSKDSQKFDEKAFMAENQALYAKYTKTIPGGRRLLLK